MSAAAAVRARSVAVPAWVWLAVIVAASSAVQIALGNRVVTPWIWVDELVYSELGKSLGANGHLLVRGVSSNGYGFVYPALIAPAFRLFSPVPDAYAAAKAINAVVMSLAAVPAYFLARRLVAPALALVAAGLALLVPSMLFTGMLMTENAFYPIFLATCLVLVATLERPTPLRQVALLALCGVAYSTRAQAIAFVPAVLVAPILHGWIEQDLKTRLRRYLPLYGVVVGAAVLALAATIARGRSPLSLLGAYRAAVDNGYTFGGVLHYLLWHLAELDLYVGVVPFAALLALWIAPRSLSPAARAYAAATLPVAAIFLVEVAAFASTESIRIEERNDFYLLPLLLIPLVALAAEGIVPRSRRALVVAAAAAGVLPVALPFARFVNPSAVSDTFGLLPWWWLQDQGIHFGPLRVVALGVGLAAGATFVLLPRRFAPALAGLVAVYFVLTTAVVENGRHGIHHTAVGSLWAGIRVAHPDWIDRAVGRDVHVSFLWHYTGDTRPLWNNEFFNRSVRDVYTVDGPDAADGGLPETPVHERADGTLVTAAGKVPSAGYAISYVDLAGKAVARDPRIGLVVYRVGGPLVILTRVTGLFPDTWSGRTVTYRRLRCTGGQLAVRVGTDEHLFSADQFVTASEGGRVVGSIEVPPAEQRTFRVPLHPNTSGTCLVRFRMAQLRSPAGVQQGSIDTRRLGAHFLAFDFTA
ncbi:MAG: glycosyltransferase family 39 protein [Actinomycetota bacterium]|nr:glycosyltransferase family 39 protein [Actinomycetota bacterium]